MSFGIWKAKWSLEFGNNWTWILLSELYLRYQSTLTHSLELINVRKAVL